MTTGSGTGADFSIGWKELVIKKAAYGDYNGNRYLDVWFEDYPENFNARIYAKKSESGEEWAIGQVFRFANAGITGGLEGTDGKVVIKMDDNPIHLAGKQVNVYLYKDGKYSRILKQFVPTAFENVAEKFNEEDIEYWKGKAIKYFTEYVQPKLGSNDEGSSEIVSSTETNENSETSNDEAIPF